jgi:hypothetical protein
VDLAQDWRLYQKLTRSKKKRLARLAGVEAGGPESGPVTVVISTGVAPRVVTVFAGGRNFEDWGGRSYEEFRVHLGEVKSLCVLSESDLRDSFGVAAAAAGLFEQRRSLREALEKKAAHRKGNAMLPGMEDSSTGQSGHFLIEALGGWWRKVFPNRYALWLRVSSVARGAPGAGGARAMPQDHLLFFKDGKIVGCGTPDLTSLGTERIWKDESVIRHLTEKYLVPIQGVQLQSQDWEAWMDAAHPWKAVRDSIQQGRVSFSPERSGLRGLVKLRASIGL